MGIDIADALFIAFLGLVVTVAAGVPLVRTLLGEPWQQTVGIVDGSRVVDASCSESFGCTGEISYHYVVAGQTYNSDSTTKYFSGSFSRSKAIRRAQQYCKANYPRGRRVTVFYDPRRPSASAFQPPTHPGAWFALAFGVVVLSAGIMLYRYCCA